ncbi:MAG: anti-sigma factor [Geminicoccaceae bacterium]
MIGPDLLTLADEYVIGLLDDADRRKADHRLTEDPDFAKAVADARERFLDVDLTESPQPITAESWARIEAKLDIPLPEPSRDDMTVVPLRRPLPSTEASSRPWKVTALAAVAASLVLAFGLAWQIGRPAPLVIAVLLDSQGEPSILIEAFDDDRTRVVPLDDVDIPQGKTLEVWTLPDVPEAKPVSLGQLDRMQTRRLRGPDLPEPRKGQLYEITIEPEGGSPTGLPTGPIVGKGFAKTTL